MADYIDRNALFSYLTRTTGFRTNCEGCTDIDCLDCIANEAIKRVPTIDVAPVRHGQWVKGLYGEVGCSLCMMGIQRKGEGGKEEWVDLSDAPFCPSCGAKMDLNGGFEDG